MVWDAPLSSGGGTDRYVGCACGRHISLRARLWTGDRGCLDRDDRNNILKAILLALGLLSMGRKNAQKVG